MKNTFLLYVRMLGLLLVSLLTTRVVLKELGENDYGIYNVVGGIVIVFSIFSSSLTASISRFLTFELGNGSNTRLRNYFSNSVFLQFILGIIICIVIEAGGIWFLYYKMNISYNMLFPATIVLQCSIVVFFINLIGTPYNAIIIAHERMSAYAILSIADVILKLLVALVISLLEQDRLIYYSLFLLLEALLIRIIYLVYCQRTFKECRLRWKIDRNIFRELLKFTGWNFIGASSGIMKDQGVNLLLNVFGNTIINAARGLSMQVASAATSFTSSFVTALNPQITKDYAVGNVGESISLTVRGAKLSAFLVWCIVLPILLETSPILEMWLSEVPVYTSLFVRLSAIYIFIETFSMTLITLLLATGNIKKYQIIVGGIQLLNFPLSWIALSQNAGFESPYYIAIAIAIVCLNLRLYILHDVVKLSIISFYKETLLPVLYVVAVSLIIPLLLEIFLSATTFKLFFVVGISLLSTLSSVYLIGLTQHEREIVIKFIKERIQRNAYQ